MPSPLTPFTPLPNDLIDRVMPSLTDTEWRLLCVVARQTLGWKEGRHGRKERDWLTHRQLCARTGRASEAVCRALDSLVRKGLITVCDDRGALLATAATRRRSSGRLFYELGPEVVGKRSAANNTEPETLISESGIRKAKTTKETSTKDSPDGGERERPGSHSHKNKLEERTLQSRRPQKPQSEDDQPEVHRFLRAYREEFRRHTPRGEPPVIDWGKDGKLVKQLLHIYSYPRLLRLLERFFSSAGDWERKQGYSLQAFKSSIGRLLISEAGAEAKLRAAVDNPVTIHTPGWSRAGEITRIERTT